jgi:hypothetical protein
VESQSRYPDPSRDLNRAPPEYEPRALPLCQTPRALPLFLLASIPTLIWAICYLPISYCSVLYNPNCVSVPSGILYFDHILASRFQESNLAATCILFSPNQTIVMIVLQIFPLGFPVIGPYSICRLYRTSSWIYSVPHF